MDNKKWDVQFRSSHEGVGCVQSIGPVSADHCHWCGPNIGIASNDPLVQLIANSERMAYILKRILEDLPANKDWLDPDLERQAREILKEIEHWT